MVSLSFDSRARGFSPSLFQGEGWGGVKLLGFEARPERPPLNLPLGRGRINGCSRLFRGEEWLSLPFCWVEEKFCTLESKVFFSLPLVKGRLGGV